MTLRFLRSATALMLLAMAGAACGDADIGEECDDVGDTNECENNAICTNEGGRGVCRLICTETAQCPSAHACNGVSGTNLKSCQPDKAR